MVVSAGTQPHREQVARPPGACPRSPAMQAGGLPVRSVKAMPGPRGLPIFGSLLDIQRDPLTFLSRATGRTAT